MNIAIICLLIGILFRIYEMRESIICLERALISLNNDLEGCADIDDFIRMRQARIEDRYL